MPMPAPTTAEQPRHVPRAEFEKMAPRYERGSRIMSLGRIRPWRRRAVRALAPRPGATYLDVGAGPGALTQLILRTEPGARVTALDESASMLEAGPLHDMPQVKTEVGDARKTPFPDAAFDGAVCGFLLRHLGEPDAFLREMRRVLRPGARLVLLEAHYPRGRLARWTFQAYFFGFAWWIGALVTRTWKGHLGLAKSLRAFGGADHVLEVAQRNGFSVLSVERGRLSGFFVLALRRDVAPPRGLVKPAETASKRHP